MKTKGFTLIELVVACTILLILSSVATSTAFNFMQAVTTLKSQYFSLKQNIAALYSDLARAKMNYETDLAILQAESTTLTAQQQQAIATDLTTWNNSASQNDNGALISQLINPDPTLPIPLTPLTPGSKSYLLTSRSVQDTVYNNGNLVINNVIVQITDINSLLRAYQLTDNGASTGNIVATITVGRIMNAQPPVPIRPTLPIIDWKPGTSQEIVFPSNLATP